MSLLVNYWAKNFKKLKRKGECKMQGSEAGVGSGAGASIYLSFGLVGVM